MKPLTTLRALLFISRTFFNDTIIVAIWTGFHVRLSASLFRKRGNVDKPQARKSQ